MRNKSQKIVLMVTTALLGLSTTSVFAAYYSVNDTVSFGSNTISLSRLGNSNNDQARGSGSMAAGIGSSITTRRWNISRSYS